MKNKNRLAGIFLMVMGAGLLLYPFYTSWQVDQTQAEIKMEWKQLNDVTLSGETGKLQDEKTIVSQKPLPMKEQPKREQSNDRKKDREQMKQHDIVGRIFIPAIALEAMIVEGVEQKHLKEAVGWMPSTALPDENGNMVLAGHRSHTYGKFFNRLGELGKGDVIKLETFSGTYTYTVSEKKVVKPTDISVIQPAGGKIVTLITCHPLNSNRYRLIIKAKQQA